MMNDGQDHISDTLSRNRECLSKVETREFQSEQIRLVDEVIEYNDQVRDSSGASWRAVTRDPDEHEELAYGPYIDALLMKKILEGPGGDCSRSMRDYLHIDTDWQVMRKLLEVGYILFDPRKLGPEDFLDLMNGLREDYGRECMNWLLAMDHYSMREELRTIPREVLDMVRLGALRFENETCVFACFDIEAYERGDVSEEETRKKLDGRDRCLAPLRRIISAIDEVLEKLDKLEAKRNQQGEIV